MGWMIRIPYEDFKKLIERGLAREITRLEIPIAKTSIIDYDVRIDGYEMVISYEEHSDFITYPQRDRKEAEKLCKIFEKYGIKCEIIETPYDFEYY